jgi:uncharacterized protein
VFRVRSALEIAPPEAARIELVAPALSDYVGQRVCREHLARFARSCRLPVVVEMRRWWSRKSDVELGLVARLSDGSYLFGECKWSRRPIDVGTLFELRRKVELVPHGAWKDSPRYALFSSGGFTPRLVELAADEQVILVSPTELFRGLSVGIAESPPQS